MNSIKDKTISFTPISVSKLMDSFLKYHFKELLLLKGKNMKKPNHQVQINYKCENSN